MHVLLYCNIKSTCSIFLFLSVTIQTIYRHVLTNTKYLESSVMQFQFFLSFGH